MLPNVWERGPGIVLRGLQQLVSSPRLWLCLPHQVQCISEGYRRVQGQRSRHHGQLMAQVFRTHGHEGLWALLGAHRPLQNPCPPFLPVSLCLCPFYCYLFASLPSLFAIVPHCPCPLLSFLKSLNSPSSPSLMGLGARTHGEGDGPKSQGILRRGVGQHLSPSPSLCFKTSITIAVLYSGAFPCISLLPP